MCDLREIKTDAEYRQKIIETGWLFWVFVLIGFDNGILGPCLPDLQAFVGVSLEQMSYVFFVQGMGALLGNVLGFLLEPRFDRRLMLCVYVTAGSVVNVLIPLVPHFYYLLLMFLLQGITKGQADFGAMSLCNVLWSHNRALPFQFIVVGAGISTFISPFIAQPFIGNVHVHLPPTHTTTPSLSCSRRHHPHGSGAGSSLPWSSPEVVNGSDILSAVASSLSSAYSPGIKWPFIVVGVTTLPAAVAFLHYYLTKPSWPEGPGVMDEEVDVPPPSLALPGAGGTSPSSSSSSSPPPSPSMSSSTWKDAGKPLLPRSPSLCSRNRRLATAFRVLVILLNLPVFGLLLTFADLLTSVGMAPPLCMTAVEASWLNTVLWGSAMVGRAVSAFILLCVPMGLQLLLSSLGLVGVGAVLVGAWPMEGSGGAGGGGAGAGARGGSGEGAVLWFGTAGVALFLTPSMPGFIAWSGDYLPVTPCFMNLCLCAAGLGEMLMPFVGGQLMASSSSPSSSSTSSGEEGGGTGAMLLFAWVIMVAMLVLFLMAGFVARRLKALGLRQD